jgi:PKD repeat protein
MEAQTTNDLQKATLITRSEAVIEVPSIASQISDGTFIPAENRVKEVNPKRWGHNTAVPGKGTPVGEDPLWQIQNAVNKSPAMDPLFTFEAASATVTPTDPTGAVGPAHFVNSWNSSFRIWDKLGNPLTPAASLGTILPGTMGDPIVVYDRFADRFLITEFYSNGFDIAICKGSDPVNDGWWVYRFPTNTFPDYPKFSVWSDGYYITANKDQSSASTSQVVFAVERDKMILGNTSAQMVGFPLTGIVTSGFYSPLGFNANGPAMPPAGNSPIVYMQDDSWSGVTVDHLKIWNVNVNWITPGSSTISSPQIINTQPFDGLFDGGSFSNLPQPSGSDIDALQATIMYMAQYRRFPTYNTVVFNFVVDLTNADNKAGIRWYELRQTTDGTPWTIYQEGTYGQPAGHSAFSGNMCMDASGNIGLAYTTVSTTQYPSLRFTGRFAGDPLGTMTFTEGVIANGVQSDPASRYGDYSQMTIDPLDDATFWSIGEYFAGGTRKNHVGVFMIAPPALTAGFAGSPTTLCSGGSVTFINQSLAAPISWEWSFPGGTPASYSGQIPPPVVYSTAGVYDVTLTVFDGISTDTEVKSGYITVSEVIANFTGTPTTVVVGNPVTFTDNSSCSPETWTWSFPGGTPSSYIGQTPPPVVYNTIGTYNISLTVTKAGGTDTKTKTGYITVTPPIFNITTGSVTTCTGDFYDTGGPAGVYQDDEVITETFYPSTPGSMIRFAFTSFATELGYDTLTIYNGVNSSAPLIGKYHGTTGPGTVTASNASGALTFRFHSDVSVTYAGWAATINCYSTSLPPVADFSASTTSPDIAQTVSFTDLSTNWATSWAWSFSPATVTYVGGTSETSRNPQVQFSAAGSYTVSLTATNAYGFDSETKINYINVINCTISTLPFSESFSATTIPNCWSQVDHQGNGQVWQFGTITTQSPNPILTGNYAYLDSDEYGYGNSQNADLITPTLNLTDYTGITLQFSHYFRSYTGSSGTLSYSINSGTTWVQMQQFIMTSATNPVVFNQVIPAIAGQAQVKFKWNYIGAYAWYWGIDNILVTGTCNTILPVSVSISASSNPADAGIPVTFTAAGVNGGTSPVYQWKVNNVNAGTNSNTYQYVPSDGDVVTCVLTSNANCITGNPASSNAVTMTVNSVPVIRNINDVTVSGTQCFDATQTIVVAGNNTAFSVVSGGSSTLIAGENILFYPGSTVSEGGYLHGYITPGGPYCIGPTKPTIAAGTSENTIRTEGTFFRVFPNPTAGDFTLTFNGTIPEEKINLVIYSMKGERIISRVLSGGINFELSLSGRPAGIYLIRVNSENKSGTLRLIKQ